eukprot:9909205-Alexandrium_andersonii.AAC.1
MPPATRSPRQGTRAAPSLKKEITHPSSQAFSISLTHPVIRSATQSFSRSVIQSLVYLCPCALVHLCIRSLSPSATHSITQPLTQSLSHAFSHSAPHPLAQPLNHCVLVCLCTRALVYSGELAHL